MIERYTIEAGAYVEPAIRVVEMSCEGLLCMSRVFMLNSYDDGGDIDLDFTMSFQPVDDFKLYLLYLPKFVENNTNTFT